MCVKRIDNLKIYKDPTRNRAWNLPSCGLVPWQTATPIVGTPKINGTIGNKCKTSWGCRAKINTGLLGSHIFLSYVAIIGANYSKKFI